MKKFFFSFAVFTALIFVASCGGSSKNDDQADTSEIVTDEDSADTDSTDDNDPGNTDPDNPDTIHDSEDSTHDDDTDTTPEQSDNDADPAPVDDSDAEQSESEECVAAGGSWNDAESSCTKTTDCAGKPENTEWNGDSSYIQTYADGAWSAAIDTEYSEEAGTCRFKCAEGYFWDDDLTCKKRIALGNICTGQKFCYDSSGATIVCPTVSTDDFYGQDAFYANNGVCTPQSFTVRTVSDQKVVFDNNTRLMWQQMSPSTPFTWENAVTYCDDLVYAGYSDWRLPNPQELLTIVDNNRYAPAVDTTNFLNIPTKNDMWTSKEYPSTNNARFFHSNSGYIGPGRDKMSVLNIICVRGEELPKAILTTQTLSGEVVVTDSATGLMWQKTYVSDYTWSKALKYCETLIYAGYADWRLPNKNELSSLLDYDKSSQPYSSFPDMPSQWFLSSTTTVYATGSLWSAGFDHGGVASSDKSGYSSLGSNVRCVR